MPNDLVRFGLINWYLAAKEDIDVIGNIAILGKNASGKSSLLDMMQTVLGGHNKNYIHLNASAGDGKKKKSARSIRDYCLGAYGADNEATRFKRQSCRSVIFLGFRNSETRQEMTIGVAMEASQSEPSERLLDRFVIEGSVLSTDLFIDKSSGKQRVIDWPTAKAMLERAGTAVHFDTSAENFIKNFTRLGSTNKRPIQPERLIKALINAISFEEIPSATHFVRNYILTPDPLDIKDLKTSIRTYHDLHKKIVELRDQLAVADEIIGKAQAHGRQLKLELDWNAAGALLDFTSTRSVNMTNRRIAARERAREAELTREMARLDAEIRKQKDEIEAIDQVLATSQQNSRRATLESQKNLVKVKRDAAEQSLRSIYLLAAKLVQSSNTAKVDLAALQAPIVELAQSLVGSQHPDWPKDLGLARRAAEGIVTHTSNAEKSIANLGGGIALQRARSQERLEEVNDLLANLRDHGMPISRQTFDLVSALKDAGMNPRVLCQLVDVLDDSWRDAAETMLGRDREAIIVEASKARGAKQMLRESGSRFIGLRIVGNDKEDWQTGPTRPDSLAAILKTHDRDAEILIRKRLGSIRRAEDVAEFNRAGRAITRDLVFDDGIVVERRRPEERRKLGSMAVNPAELEIERLDLEKFCRESLVREAALAQLASALTDFSAIGPDGLESAVSDLANLNQALQDAQDALLRAEEDLDPELTEQRRKAKATLDECEKDLTKASGDKREASLKAATAEETLGKGENTAGSNMALDLRRRTFLTALAKSSRRDAFERAREIGGRHGKLTADKLTSDARQAWQKASQSRANAERIRDEIFDLVSDFNAHYQSAAGFARSQSSIAGDVLPFFDNLARKIRETELVEHEARAKNAADDAKSMFKTSFVASLNDKIGTLDNEISRLNASLAPHRFHGERYRFKATSAAEYAELVDFVRTVANDDAALASLIDGAEANQNDKNSALISRILFDETLDVSGFDDYRNYFTFQLKMTNEATGTEIDLEKRRGIGSGAERQTPFYIAIGAALAAAWHGGREHKKADSLGIGLAIFDEAFSKMDGGNQRACLDFFKQLGLQVVIAAPPEKQAIAAENVNTIVTVTRDETHVEFDTVVLKSKVRTAIDAANPRPTKDDARRSLMAMESANTPDESDSTAAA